MFTNVDFVRNDPTQDDLMVVTIVIGKLSQSLVVPYVLVDMDTSYNLMLGKPMLNSIGAIVSTPHLTKKFSSTSRDIVMIKADHWDARE
ncbi:hypothetical protein JHK82_043885 [Glycine max]|nr:hypothetical protein JHK86_043767 [Glycine max]KAG4958052.1 hypothetical protein JHK85_044432 [Glycine max]KAG5106915.1 hypothetical protein JHK82_043885 [Glycine max]KAG5117843.1 hypothetical protein JHK84_043956 [Glycine max]